MLETIFGKRGSGKTTLIREKIKVAKKPVVIVDVLGNFDPTPDEIQGEKNPNPDKWVFCASTVDAIEELKYYVSDPKNHEGIIVVQDGDIDRCVDFVSSALWKIEGGTLVLDEADAIRIADAPCFNELIRYGRNKGIDLITGCRRPAELDKNITAGADVIYCFTTHEVRDVDYFRSKFGDEFAETLPALPNYHGIYIDYNEHLTGTYVTDKKGKIKILTTQSTQKNLPDVDKIEKPTKKVGNAETRTVKKI